MLPVSNVNGVAEKKVENYLNEQEETLYNFLEYTRQVILFFIVSLFPFFLVILKALLYLVSVLLST